MAAETATETSPAAAMAAEKPLVKDPPPPPPTAEEDPKKPAASIPPSVSFKEESNLVADLADPEKKALDELKQLIHAALANHDFTPPPPSPPAKAEQNPAAQESPNPSTVEEPIPHSVEEKTIMVEDDGAKTVEAIEETVVSIPAPDEKTPEEVETKETTTPPEEVFIWGVPLLADERSDTVLMKFLRARDFKVKEAFTMIKNAITWRKDFKIDVLVDENLGVPEMEKAVFMHGLDREGHPVCYNVYGELYSKAFADEEKKKRFLKWRIQYLEKGIRELLDFSPGGVSTMVQVTDLKNSPGPLKREFRQALLLLQDNYPEFAAKQVFINVPWWYLAYNRMISPFFTQRSKSKFVFAGPSKSAEALFKYIAPAQVPVQFGGLSKEKDADFTVDDAVTEITLKPPVNQIVEITVTEACLLVIELRVPGWDVTYGAEFVPSTKDGYTVILQKARKVAPTDEAVAKNSFKIEGEGKVVITVGNMSSKKKVLLYRYKVQELH